MFLKTIVTTHLYHSETEHYLIIPAPLRKANERGEHIKSVHILFLGAAVLYIPVLHYRHNAGALVLKLCMGDYPGK